MIGFLLNRIDLNDDRSNLKQYEIQLNQIKKYINSSHFDTWYDKHYKIKHF